jgi:hypothetical protein
MTGTIELGQGGGIVYGDFHAAGGIYGITLNAAYSAWSNTSARNFFITGGTGGGGAGGDGQLVVPGSLASPPRVLVFDPLVTGSGPVEGQRLIVGGGPDSAMSQAAKMLGLERALLGNSAVTPAAPATGARASTALVGGTDDHESNGNLMAVDAVFSDLSNN